MIKRLPFLFAALFFAACNSTKKPVQNETYFDVSGYFVSEAARLQQLQPVITKSVSIDGNSEQKTLKISDWKKELGIFESAGINKISWKGLFRVTKTGNHERYTSNDEKVLVKEVDITKDAGRVSHVFIVVHNENAIYNSIDSLNYYPDSLYSIVKTQKIKLLQARKYVIKGQFNKK